MIVELTESKEQWKLEIKYEQRKQVGSSWTAPKDRETYFQNEGMWIIKENGKKEIYLTFIEKKKNIVHK